MPILPKHIWERYSLDQIGNAEADGFFKNEPPVVGTGPYVAVEWEPGDVHPLRPQRVLLGRRRARPTR